MHSNSDSGAVAATILIKGRVQGVGYRCFAYDTASVLGLAGQVRNLSDGDVQIDVEGNRTTIEQWIIQLKKGPSLSRVENVHVDWFPSQYRFNKFTIDY